MEKFKFADIIKKTNVELTNHEKQFIYNSLEKEIKSKSVELFAVVNRSKANAFTMRCAAGLLMDYNTNAINDLPNIKSFIDEFNPSEDYDTFDAFDDPDDRIFGENLMKYGIFN